MLPETSICPCRICMDEMPTGHCPCATVGMSGFERLLADKMKRSLTPIPRSVMLNAAPEFSAPTDVSLTADRKRLAPLFAPLRIRHVELRNRFVFQPHFTALGNLDGTASDDL